MYTWESARVYVAFGAVLFDIQTTPNKSKSCLQVCTLSDQSIYNQLSMKPNEAMEQKKTPTISSYYVVCTLLFLRK